MKNIVSPAIKCLACAGLVASSSVPAFAAQRDYRWHGNEKNWDPAKSYRASDRTPRRLSRNDQIYRGRDGRTYCQRSDGTTGLVIGGVAGGVLGNVVGGGTLGTLLGAGGGALLGREIDKGGVKCQ